MKYLLTVQLEFEAADDIAAREAVRGAKSLGGLCATVALTEITVLPRVESRESITGSAKLQRLNDDRPPRLLAKWPEE